MDPISNSLREGCAVAQEPDEHLPAVPEPAILPGNDGTRPLPSIHRLRRHSSHPDLLGIGYRPPDSPASTPPETSGEAIVHPRTASRAYYRRRDPASLIRAPEVAASSARRTAYFALQAAIENDDHRAIATLSHTIGDDVLNSLSQRIPELMKQAIRSNRSSPTRLALAEFRGADLQRLLAMAIKANDEAMVRQVLSLGANPLAVDRNTRAAATPPVQELMRAARIIHRLYPDRCASEAGSRASELDRALMRFDLSEARRLLDREKEGAVFMHDRTLWQIYSGEGATRCDIKCALLALGGDALLDNLAETDTGGKSLLHAGLDKLKKSHPPLAARLRAYPYRSIKHAPPEMLNAMGRFAATGEPIVCCDLAAAWVLQRMALRNKSDYATMFSDVRTIEFAIRPDVRKAYDQLISGAKQNHLQWNRDCGRFAADQFRALETIPAEDGETERVLHMLVASPSHAMAAELKLKFGADGRRAYVVCVFDPNSTTGHKRVEVDDLEDLERLTLSQFLPTKHDAAIYFGKSDEDQFALVHVVSADALQPGSKGTTRAARLDSRCEVLTSAVLYHLLSRGYVKDLEALMPSIGARLDELGAAERIDFLAARNRSGDPAFFLAMQAGHTEAVRFFCKLVLASGLSSTGKVKLLAAARSYDRATGLEMAFQHGHAGTVAAFVAEVLDSDLPPDCKTALLSGEPPESRLPDAGRRTAIPQHRCPAMLLGFENNAAKTIETYCTQVLGSALPCADKIDLLLPESAGGFPGIGAALEKGHVESIEAFANSLAASGLAHSDRLTVFAALRNGVPRSPLASVTPTAGAVAAYRSAAVMLGIAGEPVVKNLIDAWTSPAPRR